MVSSAVTSRCTSRSASPTEPTRRAGLAGALVMALAGCGGARAPGPGRVATQAQAAADLIVVGGDVVTLDPARPHATALAVRAGAIVAVGTDAEVLALAGPTTRRLVLDGQTVTPGLVDGHCHLYGLGADLDYVSVRELSAADAAARAGAAAHAAPGSWIRGRGWDQNKWPGQEFPHRRLLDAAAPGAPIVLRRIDGHAAWVSTEAMRRAGIDRTTASPEGGEIVRDAAGEPTGVLIDNAMNLVDRAMPAPTAAERTARIERAAAAAIAVGLTGVHEMGIDADTVAAYQALDAAGRLPLRVYAYLEGDPATSAALRATPPPPAGARFALAGVKYFADGALGSRGARLLEDYADRPGQRGLWVTAPATLRRATIDAVTGGWQVAVHAIGDAGNRATLEAFAAALAVKPGDRRLRIEHLQVVHPDDLPRLHQLGVIASMQPTHATSDMPWAEQRLGPTRIAGAYAWRQVLSSGAMLVAGSDFPVEGVAPLWGVYAAVTRQDHAGQPVGGWRAGELLSLGEALTAFTAGPAYAAFAEARRGRIAVGFDADLTVYDRPLAADASLLATGIRYTIVAGAVVHAAAGAP
jgi:predicted amidohydrolase YtcJ